MIARGLEFQESHLRDFVLVQVVLVPKAEEAYKLP